MGLNFTGVNEQKLTPQEILWLARRYADSVVGGGMKIYADTTANWDSQIDLIGERGCIYIYADHEYKKIDGSTEEGPGIKVGDGLAYLIDLPFLDQLITDQVMAEIGQTGGVVTEHEKEFWNNKVSSYLSQSDSENLVLSKIYYVLSGDTGELIHG